MGEFGACPRTLPKTTVTPCSAARVAITMQPSTTEFSPQANHIVDDLVQSTAMTGLTRRWRTAKSSQYATARGGFVGQIEHEKKPGVM